MATWVTLNGGSSWALQLDGIIYRTGTAGGNMILIEHATDFEFFSRTSHGAMQGYGYQLQEQGITGPRLVRLQSVTSFSFHDMILVDAPVFHLVCDTCTNGEIYNTIIRGGNKGGLDGIDVWGSNVHVHVSHHKAPRLKVFHRFSGCRSNEQGRVRYGQVASFEYADRRHLLQLVRRLRYGLLRG